MGLNLDPKIQTVRVGVRVRVRVSVSVRGWVREET